jgi:3-dehydroquinate synthetase
MRTASDDSAIIALNDGVIGDLAGLVAAAYARGVHSFSCR